jgi:perosamine synthetase
MNEELLQALIVNEYATLRDAMLSFERSALRVVLICDDTRRLLGLATEGDVRRTLLAGHGLEAPLLTFANRTPATGQDTMAREELVALLTERVHCLPVLDAEGIVHDFLFYDKRTMIPLAAPVVGERELRYVTDAVLSGWISSQGKYIGLFEEQFATLCGTNHAVAVSNGTVALHMALTALGIGPGDEVIVPALTFVATASAVCHCHAKPVFVDIEESTWNIDPEKIEAAITPHTKAIIPVHLYGMPCRMDRIIALAHQHKLWVVEDAAEAHGAEYQGKRMGSWGHIGCFSFYGNKIITTGEGGMVVTNDQALNDKLRILRDHGMNPQRRYWHDVVGFNYRMTNLQAAIGVAQLERWEKILATKDQIRQWYDSHISMKHLSIARATPDMRPVCWLYTALLNTSSGEMNRDALLEGLKAEGIDSRPVFFPVPAMPPYFENNWALLYPVTRYVSERGFSLPSSVELNGKDLDRVTEGLNRLLGVI